MAPGAPHENSAGVSVGPGEVVALAAVVASISINVNKAPTIA